MGMLSCGNVAATQQGEFREQRSRRDITVRLTKRWVTSSSLSRDQTTFSEGLRNPCEVGARVVATPRQGARQQCRKVPPGWQGESRNWSEENLHAETGLSSKGSSSAPGRSNRDSSQAQIKGWPGCLHGRPRPRESRKRRCRSASHWFYRADQQSRPWPSEMRSA